jgi:hypothetical protein
MHARRPRKWWQPLKRSRCVCGLPWPCIEALMNESRQREEHRARTSVSDPAFGVPAWATSTMPLFQVGRAGGLTPAQERRASRGPSC